jgi:[histone H3]-lysine36 N-trimethyltransferase
MDKFHHKLPKEELKKFAREVNKKLVASDYKNNRVENPTSITSKQEKKVKKYVKDFFDRAVVKYRDHEKRKADRTAGTPAGADASKLGNAGADGSVDVTVEDDVVLSDVEDGSPSSHSSERKRKREDDDAESAGADTPSETPSLKRVKEDDAAESPSPPPPPPPPTDTPLTEEERSMREQEEALMRENEEAQRLEEEAEKSNNPRSANGMGGKSNGGAGVAASVDMMDIDPCEATDSHHLDGTEARKQEVLSH